MPDMAGPAQVITSLPSDVRKKFEEEKARLAAAKANPPIAPAAPEASRLEKRQELGSVLKQFARDQVKVDPEQMVKIGADVGVSRGQLSDLYKKYRGEFEAEAPEGSAPALAKAAQQPAESTTGMPQQPAYQEPSVTPNMDAYAQSSFGEGAGGRRSLESESGKALRIARKLDRQGFGRAAESMALMGAQAKMSEPSIKTEEYRKQQGALQKATLLEEQKTLADQKRALELQNRVIEARNKQALTEFNSGKGLSKTTASLFGM